MEENSSNRAIDGSNHHQWRPSGLLKFSHAFFVVVLYVLLLLVITHGSEAQEEPQSNPNHHQMLLYGESTHDVGVLRKPKTALGMRNAQTEEPVRFNLGYRVGGSSKVRIQKMKLQTSDDKASSPFRYRPAEFNAIKRKRGFNAIKSLMGLQSRSLSRSVSLARSTSQEDYIGSPMQTRRSMRRQFRPRLRWG